ncbi:MAG: PTS IIA-like nitrogen-regulatory protein PtsN [Gammaproteobacteria bacterium HGW-Gammaproteobacteria-4]|jgi:PTS system nitrogen regulatory IIA component|nr:MAG: PTS IIA-like nitrogen-regulatory protein PtsN [Gammaproteobacteria bacterium HGW-Gammaproteobacteria-4]
MHLIDLLSPSRVRIERAVTSKKRLLENLAALLSESLGGELERAIFDNLCARERMGSTALGHGVAIPHGRCAQLNAAIGAFVRLSEPVDFGAADGQPVDLIFALAVPQHFTHQHLVLLAELADMFARETVRDKLRAAPDTAALYRLLSDWQPASDAAA